MEDLISRQVAIDALNEIRHILDRKEKELTILPSAQPERKKGEWIKCDVNWFKTMCKCSKCGAMIDINEKYRNFFCYHCGARMDGEQDAGKDKR